jgi:hypothetical protein
MAVIKLSVCLFFRLNSLFEMSSSDSESSSSSSSENEVEDMISDAEEITDSNTMQVETDVQHEELETLEVVTEANNNESQTVVDGSTASKALPQWGEALSTKQKNCQSKQGLEFWRLCQEPNGAFGS